MLSPFHPGRGRPRPEPSPLASLRHPACWGLALVAVAVVSLPAQVDSAKTDSARKVVADLGPMRTIEFDTDEGTWMNLDVSPDGRTIVFELLGDLYTLPIEGGEAKALLTGRAWDRQPRFSPDGKWIAYSSDKDGTSNLWIVKADGTDARQLTKENYSAVTQPVWTPDGHYILVKKQASGPMTFYSSELWLIHRDGGSGFKLTDATKIANATDAAFTPDGRFVYFSGPRGPSLGPELMRLDRQTGVMSRAPTRSGVGSVIAPDGRTLAYVRRHHATSELRLHDLPSGGERVLVSPVTTDDGENFLWFQGGYPGMAFTPDGSTLVLTVGGKIHAVRLADGSDRIIPFRARIRQEVASVVGVSSRISDDPVSVKSIRWATTSPDGRQLAFSALGKLFLMALPDGQPRRLTSASEREYAPAFSPDGRWIAYTTWSDSAGGQVRIVAPDGSAARPVVASRGHYLNPSWSRDGRRIVFVSSTAPEFRGLEPETVPYYEVLWVPADGGNPALVTSIRPAAFSLRAHPVVTFNGDGSRVFFTEQSPVTGSNEVVKSELVSVRLDGTDRKSHLRFTSVDEVVPSPDGTRAALVRLDNVWTVALPSFPTTVVDVTFESTGALPTRQLSLEGGGFIAWQDDSTLTWSFTNRLFRQRGEAATRDTIPIRLTVPRHLPNGIVAFTNARIVTMRGDEVVTNGTILVERNRIAAVGGSVPIPHDATRISLAGKTVIPGLVDVHAHLFYNAYEVFPQQKWQFLANLAYGVTTSYDPSAHSIDAFPQGEMVESGDLVGPRIFSSGDVIYGSQVFPSIYAEVRTIEDARRIVRRYQAYGALMLKSYLQPTRIARQLLNQAARELGVRITAEGGGDMYLDLSMVADGFTAFEHSLPIAPLYRDVVEFLARAGTHYTPTLLVSYGGLSAEEYYFGKDNHHDDPKLRRFTPEEKLEPWRRRQVAPEDEYHFRRVAASAAAITKAGGNVSLGAHGELQGLGAHWELWSLADGGLTPLQAIRNATLVGAQKLGLDQDIGSIERGKLADFIVLDGNPLTDIRRTEQIRYVVKNGFVYDGLTMTEVWPRYRPLARFYWMNDADARRFAAPVAQPVR